MHQHVAAVLGAGCAWGFMGVFTRTLAEFGVTPEGSVALRCGIAAVAFFVLICLTDRSQLRVRLVDLWCFLGVGIVSLLLFTFCYFSAIELMSLSAAAILLYTAPIIVVLLSAVLFKERLTTTKVVAMIMAFVGCALVSGIVGGLALTSAGLLFGLGAGLGYALFTIFSRFALQRGYGATTINFYACTFATLGTFAIWQPVDAVRIMFSSAEALAWSLGLGLLTCFLAYWLYTYALTGLENGRASVLASVEPVVASMLGVVVFTETPTAPMLIGVSLVLGAVVLLNANPQTLWGRRTLAVQETAAGVSVGLPQQRRTLPTCPTLRR